MHFLAAPSLQLREAPRFSVINASSALRCTDSNHGINVIQITSPFEFEFKFEFKRPKFSAHPYFSNHIRIPSELRQPEKTHSCISRSHFKYFQKGWPALLHIDSLFSVVLSKKLQTIEYHDLALQIRSAPGVLICFLYRFYVAANSSMVSCLYWPQCLGSGSYYFCKSNLHS